MHRATSPRATPKHSVRPVRSRPSSPLRRRSSPSTVTPRRRLATAPSAASTIKDSDVVILSAVRTPLGSFNGALASFTATQLGSLAVKEAVKRSGVQLQDIDEAILGNVLSANLGQAPARQAALGAGLLPSTICTTVNKVCSSGMKTIMMAANEIRLGQAKVIVAGGFESMTNSPYYLPAMRQGARMGDNSVVDGMMVDGLVDPYGKFPMGNCAEVCAEAMHLTRDMQDAYAKTTYERAQHATSNGKFRNEIVPVQVTNKKQTTIVQDDEEPFKVNFDKLSSLRPVFQHPTDSTFKSTVTAANASVISDGAAALVIASGQYAKQHNLSPIAKILAYADSEQEPVWFTTAPSLAIPKALAQVGLQLDDVKKFEINEAFSVVALANQSLMGIAPEKLNTYGGAVALGHPLGASGARIVVTLLSALEQDVPENERKIGAAGICNGGGGASALIVEKL